METYLIKFLENVISLCEKHNGSITSWRRTIQRNKMVGGVPNSYHLSWLGIDVVLDEMEKNSEFENDCRVLNINPIYEKDHYHLQPMKG